MLASINIRNQFNLHWHPQQPGWMHCEGDGSDEELVSLNNLMVNEGAALREAGAKFS